MSGASSVDTVGAPAVAVDRAVAYLERQRCADGWWYDYQLPVGPSQQWVTAFVGLCLWQSGHERARTSARLAAEQLDTHRSYDAGWGYNQTTGPDADSTAHALLLLRAAGRQVRPVDTAFLEAHWTGSGFATYRTADAWGIPHPCVTPLAFLACSGRFRRSCRDALLDTVKRTRRADGSWPSYWWHSELYSTYLHLYLLNELGAQSSALTEPSEDYRYRIRTPFELTYALGAGALVSMPREQLRTLSTALLQLQQEDGSWPGSAALRVTEPDCREPWIEPRGTLYHDVRGLIATAGALRSLAVSTGSTVLDSGS